MKVHLMLHVSVLAVDTIRADRPTEGALFYNTKYINNRQCFPHHSMEGGHIQLPQPRAAQHNPMVVLLSKIKPHHHTTTPRVLFEFLNETRPKLVCNLISTQLKRRRPQKFENGR